MMLKEFFTIGIFKNVHSITAHCPKMCSKGELNVRLCQNAKDFQMTHL